MFQLEILKTCVFCDNCKLFCPENAVFKDPEEKEYSIEHFACTLCQLCIEVCPVNAIRVNTKS